MPRTFVMALAGLACAMLWSLTPLAQAQGYRGSSGSSGSPGGPPMGGSGDFLRRMDANGNGVLEPNELSERSRYFVDRAAREAGLDPSRPLPLNRLEEAMRQRFSGGSSSGSSGRSYGGSSDRSWGGGDRSSGGDRSWGGGDRSSGGDRSWGGGDRSGSSNSAPAAAAAPALPAGVQGFGTGVQLALVPGFGSGAAGLGLETSDLREAEEKLRDADRNRDSFVDQDEGRREDVGPDFWAYDRNADGKLALDELAARYQARRMARMTAKVEQRDLDEAKETIRRYDKNHDGMLDDGEIKESRYADEYRRYDLNHDGKVSLQEMAHRYAGRRVNTAPIPTGKPGTPGAMASLGARPGSPAPASSSQRPPSSSSSSSSSSNRSGGSSSSDQDQRIRSMVDERMAETDKNKDGNIDKQEFEANRGRFRSEMKEYDTNGDGRISKDELLKRYQSRMGGGPPSGGPGGWGGGSPGGWGGGSPGGWGGGSPGGWGGGGSPGGWGGSRDGSRDSGSRDGGSRDGGRDGYSRDRSRDSNAQPAKTSSRFLTPTERLDSNLPEWFAQKDKNGDGQIAMAEFTSTWSEKDAAEFLRADLNGDGIITAKECLLGPAVSAPAGSSSSSGSTSRLSSSSAPVADAKLTSTAGTVDERTRRFAEGIVKKYDKNGDGVLDAEEAKGSSTAGKADKDGDGKVTVDELTAAMTKK